MKILIAGLLVSVMLLVPINSAYSNIGIQINNKPINPSNRGNTLYVGGNGPGNYSNIQDAINDASSIDTVFVYNGTYYENIWIKKPIDLIGANRDKTVIDGRQLGTVITIFYPGNSKVKVSGFKIINNSIPIYQGPGIQIFFGYTNISGNIFSNNYLCSIDLVNSSNNIISNNIFLNNEHGIQLWGSNNKIFDNTFLKCGIKIRYTPNHSIIENNTVNGKPIVYLEEEKNKLIDYDVGQVILFKCDNITVKNQNITQTNIGIQLHNTHNCYVNNNIISLNKKNGIYLENSNRNTITDNTIISNNRSGIEILKSNNNTIKDNNISKNDYGLDIYRSCYNNIQGNKINNCTHTGIESRDSNLSLIYSNSILNNFRYGMHLTECSKYVINNNIIANNLCGVYMAKCYYNTFYKNNFVYNRQQVDFFNSKNFWIQNYWNRPRILPKFIFGRIEIGNIKIPWFNIDWNPAKKPYDIPGNEDIIKDC